MIHPPLRMRREVRQLHPPTTYCLVELPGTLRDPHALVPGFQQPWDMEDLRKYGMEVTRGMEHAPGYPSPEEAARVGKRLLRALVPGITKGQAWNPWRYRTSIYAQYTPLVAWALGIWTWEVLKKVQKNPSLIGAGRDVLLDHFYGLPWIPPGLRERGNTYEVCLGALEIGEPNFQVIEAPVRDPRTGTDIIGIVQVSGNVVGASVVENPLEPEIMANHLIPLIPFSGAIGVCRRVPPPIFYPVFHPE